MEFLVRFDLLIDSGSDPEWIDFHLAAEAQRASALAAAGVLTRIWRVPGERASWSLWEATDATALHDAISSLPLWPRIAATVHPLAKHINDPAATGSSA